VPHVAAVTEVDLVGQLASGQPHLGGVHDHDEVAAVHMWRIGRLVLAADQLSDDTGEPSERHAFGVNQMPVVTDVRRRGGKGLHLFAALGFWTGPN